MVNQVKPFGRWYIQLLLRQIPYNQYFDIIFIPVKICDRSLTVIILLSGE